MAEPCVKCGHESRKNRTKFEKALCSVCYVFSPEEAETFESYVNEKIDGNVLNSFRNFSGGRGETQKKGMAEKASRGMLMSRAPFGYRMENKELIPAENYLKVEEIFEEFLGKNESLNQIARRFDLSVNGLKKILTNFTYIGKIKFNNEIYDGKHQPIISSTLFNRVQDKLEKLKINLSPIQRP